MIVILRSELDNYFRGVYQIRISFCQQKIRIFKNDPALDGILSDDTYTMRVLMVAYGS